MPSALPRRHVGLAVPVESAVLDVGGDQHLPMVDLHQVAGHDTLDRLPGQHDRDPVSEPGQMHQTTPVHPPLHPDRGREHRRVLVVMRSRPRRRGRGSTTTSSAPEPGTRLARANRSAGTAIPNA